MKTRITLLFSLFILPVILFAQLNVTVEWRQNLKNSLNSVNRANCLRIDTAGTCYVVGTTWLPDSTKDILIIRYDTSGTEVWRRIYDDPKHGDDIPFAMALDDSGNVVIAGMSKGSPENGDFLVVKFSPEGIPVYDKIFDGESHLYDGGTAVVCDKAGSSYATGYVTTADSGINLLILAHRTDGTLKWFRTFATTQMDIGNAIAIDDSCNIYVTGNVNAGPHSSDIIVQKYDSTGKKKWQIIYNGIMSENDASTLIDLDDSVNVYISGFINHVNSRADVPVLKISRNGVKRGDTFFNGGIADCFASSINADSNEVWVTAYRNDYNIGSKTSVAVKFDKGGNQKMIINNPLDVNIFSTAKYNSHPFILGSKITHPESTLIPFFAGFDTSGQITWHFEDGMVFGLSHIITAEQWKNYVYFLGDDAGDATGSISVLKYKISGEVKEEVPEKPKPAGKKPRPKKTTK
jgi:hypothetical protein